MRGYPESRLADMHKYFFLRVSFSTGHHFIVVLRHTLGRWKDEAAKFLNGIAESNPSHILSKGHIGSLRRVPLDTLPTRANPERKRHPHHLVVEQYHL